MAILKNGFTPKSTMNANGFVQIESRLIPRYRKAGIAALRVAEELALEYANGYSDAQLAHAIDIWLRIQSVTTRVEKAHVKILELR